MPEPMIIVDPALSTPGDREFWTSPEMFDYEKRSPAYSISETAKCFFGMSPGWIRWRLRQRFTDAAGVAFELERSPAGDRYFRLYDIERWAHMMADHQALSTRHLELVIMAVKVNAQLHEFIS